MKIASSLSVLSAVAAVLCCPAWVAAEAPPAVRVWRLPRGAAVKAADLDARKGWTLLDPDAAAPQDVAAGLAVETPHVVAVLSAGGRGAGLFTRGKGAARHVRQELVLVDAQGREAGGLGAFRLVSYDRTAAEVSLSAGAAAARL